MKVYFDKTWIGSHVFNFGNRTPVRFAHFDYHIFGGTNQGVQGLESVMITLVIKKYMPIKLNCHLTLLSLTINSLN
jgi:hypothetical protein